MSDRWCIIITAAVCRTFVTREWPMRRLAVLNLPEFQQFVVCNCNRNTHTNKESDTKLGLHCGLSYHGFCANTLPCPHATKKHIKTGQLLHDDQHECIQTYKEHRTYNTHNHSMHTTHTHTHTHTHTQPQHAYNTQNGHSTHTLQAPT